jgi:ribosomal protein L37E
MGYTQVKESERTLCVQCGKRTLTSWAKYCSNKCQHIFENEEKIRIWLAGGIGGNGRVIFAAIRRYLLEEAKWKCIKCGWGKPNEKTGFPILEIDHIDGNPENHSRENLMVLCPNCHSLTATYKGLNVGWRDRLPIT